MPLSRALRKPLAAIPSLVPVAAMWLAVRGSVTGAQVVFMIGLTGMLAFVVGFLAVSRGQAWHAAPKWLPAHPPWRETSATVLDLPGTVLALPGGEFLEVDGLPAPIREMVIRARRVWVTGAEGRVAVRVDGLSTAWPA